MGSGNGRGSDSNPCPPGRSSPFMVGAATCATAPPFVYILDQKKKVAKRTHSPLPGYCLVRKWLLTSRSESEELPEEQVSSTLSTFTVVFIVSVLD